MQRCFALVRVIDPVDLSKDFWQSPLSASTVMAGSQRTRLPRSTAVFRAAIASYAEQPVAAFNAFLACRTSRPLPRRFEENLIEFIEKSRGVVQDHASIVASALAMDAHTDGGMQSKLHKLVAVSTR